MIFSSLTLSADRYTDLAEQHYGWLRAESADSIIAHASPEVRAQLTADMLNGIWKQLQTQAGELQTAKEWRHSESGNMHICSRVLVFDKVSLQLNTVFNDRDELAGITITPAPADEADSGNKPTEKEETRLPEEVTEREITVGKGRISLPGKLTLPREHSGKLPAVVLVHGSGPNDMDETLGPNKPFRELAYALAGQGIAVMRYDKRTHTYGASTAETSGSIITYDTETVDDAVQAVVQAASIPEIDSKRIFVLGHSMGGYLLPRIANKCTVHPAGIIGMAAPFLPLDSLLPKQLAYIGRHVQGLGETEARQLAEKETAKVLGTLPPAYLDMMKTYDPAAEAARMKKMPTLFVQGGHDYQVTETDLRLWEKALKDNDRARFLLLENLDHLMRQTPAMAVPADYQKSIPVSESFIREIATFIKQGK